MANMAYCRFENTLSDLHDCFENWEEKLSESEQAAQRRMLKLCEKIAAEYGEARDAESE